MTPRLGSLNEFCWMDVKTRDLPGTAAFFADTLGWRFAVDKEDWRRATKITAPKGHRIGGVSDLAQPVYPPGTPAHIACYLAVDDVDRRTDGAVGEGARVVVPPFDAGDQGRMVTLVDPVGAAVSLWQPYRFGGWAYPPDTTGTPHRMVLSCGEPGRARDFYREVTGTAFAHAEFAVGTDPQWEVTVGVDDVEGVVARLHGRGQVVWLETGDRPVLRLSSSEGLTFQVRSLRDRG
ncbi:VOC family protein [Streptomyces sp. NPDC012510]|uniref:VOC family protein n=1 Tax=Streptomyces sp. NPDC012510 TaxID=3364838 RepID=UPI0036EF5D13